MSFNETKCFGCKGVEYKCMLPIKMKNSICPCSFCIIKTSCTQDCKLYNYYLEFIKKIFGIHFTNITLSYNKTIKSFISKKSVYIDSNLGKLGDAFSKEEAREIIWKKLPINIKKQLAKKDINITEFKNSWCF